MAKADREGCIFGPAQLGEGDDPQMRLKREKREKVEAARRARLATGG